MRTRSLIARTILLGVLAGLSMPFPASAAGEGDASSDVDGPTFRAAVQIVGGGYPGSSCTYSSQDSGGTYGDEDLTAPLQTQVFPDGHQYALFYRECADGRSGSVWIPLDMTAGDLLPALRDEVERRLHFPEPVYEPFDTERDQTYVRVPIDFRTTPETWQPITATAYIDGPAGFNPWITITAEPTELWFASGDTHQPGPVACAGADPIAPYVAETPGACSFTYRNASTITDANEFPAEFAINWTVTYDSSDGPGALDMDPTITPAPIRIAEIKGLVTCTGSHPLQGGC